MPMSVNQEAMHEALADVPLEAAPLLAMEIRDAQRCNEITIYIMAFACLQSVAEAHEVEAILVAWADKMLEVQA